MTHGNGQIREWLKECGPASVADYARAHGLAPSAAEKVSQHLSKMFRDGVLSRIGRGGCGHPFVYAVAREIQTREERVTNLIAARRAITAKRGRKPKQVKPRERLARPRRAVTDRVHKNTTSTKVSIEKPKHDTQAFIDANPDRYQKLATDHPWTKPAALTNTNKKVIRGMP